MKFLPADFAAGWRPLENLFLVKARETALENLSISETTNSLAVGPGILNLCMVHRSATLTKITTAFPFKRQEEYLNIIVHN